MLKKILCEENKILVRQWLAFMFFLQVMLIVISTFFNLNLYILKSMSATISLISFFFFISFPFYLVKRDIKSTSCKTVHRKWLIGFIISVVFATLMFVLGLLGLIIKVFFLMSGEYVSHVGMIIQGSAIGWLIMVGIGTVSGWLSDLIYRRVL